MRRRRRVLAGLLAMMALTFSLAESVWASTCAPEMGGAATAAVNPGGDPDCARDAGGAEGKHGPAAPKCPLGSIASAQGCLAAASLPSVASDMPVVRMSDEAEHFSEPAHHEQVSSHTLFRPPRLQA